MSNIFTRSFLVLLKAVKAARGGKYVHRELIGTVTDKKGKIRNKWKYFYNQGTLQKELAEWKAQFEAKQAKQKKNLFATSADIKNVQQRPDQKSGSDIYVVTKRATHQFPSRTSATTTTQSIL